MNSEPSALRDLEEDDLLELIGAELAKHEEAALPFSREELISKGKKWLQGNWNALHDTVCASPQIRELVEKAGSKSQLILAVSDLITGLVTGVTPITVAYLLTKTGIEKLCEPDWRAD